MSQLMSSSMLYHRLGWSVVPANGDTKSPLIGTWKRYQTKRPSLRDLHDWSAQFPTAGIAIITGHVSGIVVLDADGVPGIEEVRRKGTPPTPTAATPRGGRHFYFRLDPQTPEFANSTKVGDSRSIDIRGPGALVIAPHTRRRDGKRYTWLTDPAKTPLAPPPAWFTALFRAPAAPPPREVSVGPANGTTELHGLVGRLPARVREWVVQGHDLAVFPSRSECDAAVVGALLLAGASHDEIAAVFDAYPIGAKARERGGGYLLRTIDHAAQRVRLVRIRYADLIEYGMSSSSLPPGRRVHLCLVVEDGEDRGRFIRVGVSVPEGPRSGARARWERVFECAGVALPQIDDLASLRSACRVLVGKLLRVELARSGNNPVAGFYSGA